MTCYNILVVDDEKPVRDLIVGLLCKNGHHCEIAEDGREALEKIKKNAFDSAIIDVVMPHMDGITLTRKLVGSQSDLPILVMTGHADEYSAGSAIAAGAREFIKKPFSINEFLLRFDKMMQDRKEEEALLALSLTDELTDLYNRRRFFVLSEQYLKVALRTKKRILLFYLDMDDLKAINDRCGHNEGDQALIALGSILKRSFRESDIIARIGGDEFVVLLESGDDNEAILKTRLNENIKEYNAKVSQGCSLSVSIGVAEFDPEHPVTIDELLSRADALMYAQKRKRQKNESGRNAGKGFPT